MELDELKTSWSVLNERLEQNEILNKRIIKEMIANRTNSAYNRLLRYDVFGGLLVLSCCILVLVVKENVLHLKTSSFILLEGVLIYGMICHGFHLWLLSQFNMETKNIYELMKLTSNYRIWTKRNEKYGALIGVVTVGIFFILQEANWILLLIITIIFSIVVYFLSIRFYNKNIDQVQKGLKELEEFEEE